MDIEEAKERIENLEADSFSSQLKPLIPLIVEKIEAGVRVADISAALKASGFEVNINTLRSCIYRYNKKKGGEQPSKNNTNRGIFEEAPRSKKEPLRYRNGKNKDVDLSELQSIGKKT